MNIDTDMSQAAVLREIAAYAASGVTTLPEGEPWSMRAPERLGLATGTLEVIAMECRLLAERLEDAGPGGLGGDSPAGGLPLFCEVCGEETDEICPVCGAPAHKCCVEEVDR